MENQHTEEELKNIAKQLSCPEGQHGIKTGEMMNANNIGMTYSAIDALDLQFNVYVLEIGPGNGSHVEYFLSKEKDLVYIGIDISETMIAEATKINQKLIDNSLVYFHQVDGKTIPLITGQFDKIFTVNTVYFWENPLEYLSEIKRVLSNNGLFVLCFADKQFMQKLPFTSYGFKLYNLEDVEDLLRAAGFTIKNTIKKTEQIKSNAGTVVERPYYVVVAANM